MANVKEILEAHKYPPFVKDHPIWKDVKSIDKIFPQIGLPNCEEEITIDNSAEVSAAATALITQLNYELMERQRKLTAFGQKKTAPKAKRMKPERKAKFELCQSVMKSLQEMLQKQQKHCIVKNNERLTLNLPSEIKAAEDKPIFKAGEGLFRVYNKVNDLLTDGNFLPMHKLDDMFQFKDFSSKNIPATKHKLIFSSEGPEGVWDIATMSMRGISSCQTWGTGNSTHIVGSMLDPFTGIIYLTSGAKFNEHGSKMIRRCVVRFVVQEKTKQPVIFLERMYPAYDKATGEAFIEFLNKHLDGKFKIINGNTTSSIHSHYVPMANVVKKLDAQHQPYRDSQMQYKVDAADVIGAMREKAEQLFGKLHAAVGAKVLYVARNLKMGKVPEAYKETFRMIRGTSTYSDISYFIYDDLVAMSKKLISDIDYKKYDDLNKVVEETMDTLSKSVEEKIFDTLKSSIKTRLKTAYAYSTIKRKTTLPDKLLKEIAVASAEKVKAFIDEEREKFAKSKKDTQVKMEELPVYAKLLNQ